MKNQPDPEPISGKDLVRLHLEQMDLRQRIGQRFMMVVPPGFGMKRPEWPQVFCFGDQTSPSYNFVLTALTGKPAGMILYNRIFEDREETEVLIEDLREIAGASQPGRGFFISVHREIKGSAVYQYPDTVRLFPVAEIGQHRDFELSNGIAYLSGEELLSMNINTFREEMGLNRIIMIGDFSMDSLPDNYDLDVILEQAISSEVDLVLLHSKYNLLDAIDRVEKMVREGQLTEKEIDRGVERILSFKYRHDLLENPQKLY